MNVEKLVAGLVAIGMVTTLILPKRQTVPVMNAGANLVAKVFGTVMGTAKPA